MEDLDTLINQLQNPDGTLDLHSVMGIWAAALKRSNLAGHIPFLREILESAPETSESQTLARTLGDHYLDTRQWGEVWKMLNHPCGWVRVGLWEAFLNDIQYFQSYPFDRHLYHARKLMGAFQLHLQKGKWEEAPSPLDILTFLGLCPTIAEADSMQRIFEDAFQTGWVKQPWTKQHCRPEELHAQAAMLTWAFICIQEFASRKSELAKKRDGVLLTGETIPFSSRSEKRIYQVISGGRAYGR